jgi:pyruvate dehydrogenase E1 component
MTTAAVQNCDRTALMHEVGRRVLWLSAAMVDHANRARPNPTRLKVGGHQMFEAAGWQVLTAKYGRLLGGDLRAPQGINADSIVSAGLDVRCR